MVEASSGRAPGKTFPRTARLLKHADFDHVYRNGKRYHSPLMSVFYLDRRAERPEQSPRVGLTAGRVLGGAVDRNRIKRRMRAMIREHLKVLIPGVDVVMNPKRQVLQAEATRLSEEVRKAFVAIAKLDSRPPALARDEDAGNRPQKATHPRRSDRPESRREKEKQGKRNAG